MQPAEDQHSIALRLTLGIQALLVLGLGLFIWREDWENVFLTVIVIGLTLVPALLARRWRVIVPPEFQLLSAGFVFLTLFLGSAFDYYYKYWWWDIVMHTGSGFLLGIIGFLAIFLLNQTNQLPKGMKPRFACIFAVTFAVTLGVIWEIFEFAVDSASPTINMQSNETGVRDTMHDLIVDTIGATIVGLMGWAHAKRGRYSFLADAIGGFMKRNPGLFEDEKKSDRP